MYGRQVAIAAIESGVADALLVRALDRATRGQRDGADLLDRAITKGWRLLDCERTDTADPTKRFEADIRIAMAAEERRRIGQRTKDGLARARASGTRSGKPIGRPKAMDDAVEDRIVGMRMRDKKSAYAIAQELTKSKVPTPRGGARWYPTTVLDVFARKGIQ
jgi:DNA invertase Pin-like site-specific DNA recombinase